ncbi:hypothetical protein ACWD4B_30225 [Streptomyces sp. NPDC002536]
MTKLVELALAIMPVEGPEPPIEGRLGDAERDFIETVTFADADQILEMIRFVLDKDWGAFPVWARNLSYRLACLQRPDDAALLREAASDLGCFGPDWDEFVESLRRRADRLEQEGL